MQKTKKNNDPLFKFSYDIRLLILQSIKRGGFVKNSHTEDIVGCKFELFYKHIEDMFESWMTWGNHGSKGYKCKMYDFTWEYEHIIPMTKAKSLEEAKELNHYLNLRPLCALKNNQKSNFYREEDKTLMLSLVAKARANGINGQLTDPADIAAYDNLLSKIEADDKARTEEKMKTGEFKVADHNFSKNLFIKTATNTMATASILSTFIRPAEGGLSDRASDIASTNPCPYPNATDGKRYHTNKGFTWTSWSSVMGSTPESAASFYSMSDYDWNTMFTNLYWDKILGDQINSQQIANVIGDWLFNSGKYAEIDVQKLLDAAFSGHLAIDGCIGGHTIDFLNSVDEPTLYADLIQKRKDFYSAIVANDPAQAENLAGWMNRIANLVVYNAALAA